MYFCEIVIGPPGSGKSTYVLEKSKKLEHRNLWTINLDPDNINKDFYNFNIDKSIKNYQIQNDMGPNSSTKELLNNFAHNINDFYHEYMVEKSEYFIFDLPGQIEFFINNDSLSKMINFFNSKNISVVIINMIDLVFFNTSLLSSYLFTYISVLLLEVPYVCVISKCDKYIDYCMDYELEDLINTNVLNLIKPKKNLKKSHQNF
ncbi:atp binding protein [Vairimorpha apis BRL 01]|uniref:GPN-loop GTPase n=1 Tax=Vairimorpha apis BRL 01 TaxID=1037528 RepID=T0LA95_9MICR|nr:atp binding protein [Vairimorpha apis BRL 01]